VFTKRQIDAVQTIMVLAVTYATTGTRAAAVELWACLNFSVIISGQLLSERSMLEARRGHLPCDSRQCLIA